MSEVNFAAIILVPEFPREEDARKKLTLCGTQRVADDLGLAIKQAVLGAGVLITDEHLLCSLYTGAQPSFGPEHVVVQWGLYADFPPRSTKERKNIVTHIRQGIQANVRAALCEFGFDGVITLTPGNIFPTKNLH